MFHYTHRHILEHSSVELPTPVGGVELPTPVGEKMLWCLHHNLIVNLKVVLVWPYFDMW